MNYNINDGALQAVVPYYSSIIRRVGTRGGAAPSAAAAAAAAVEARGWVNNLYHVGASGG